MAGKLSEKQWRQYGTQQFHYHLRKPNEIVVGDPLRLDVVIQQRRGDSRVSGNPGRSWTFEYWTVGDANETCKVETPGGQKIFAAPENGAEYVVPFIVTYSNVHPGRHTARAKIKVTDASETERPQQMEIPAEYDLGEFSFDVLPRVTRSGLK